MKTRKLDILIPLFLLSFTAFGIVKDNSIDNPNESKIYYHIHQATRWAEIHHSKKHLFSRNEMEKHLGKLKYSEVNLVNSKLYSEYLYLVKLSKNLVQSKFTEIKKIREKVHSKTERLKIKHPDNWQDEFILFN
jgi:tmRNA-binding protein